MIDPKATFHAVSSPTTVNHGITQRDWLAAMAMQGLMANPNKEMVPNDPKTIAAWAYDQSDAMIERSKQ